MIKKIMCTIMTAMLCISLTGCSSETTPNKEDAPKEDEVKSREFQESAGLVKYITIDDEKVSIPETVGEYVGYLEKLGKVELGDTGNSISEADKMDANGIASLTSYLKVYTDTNDYQWFGIHYFNPTNNKIAIKDAKVDRITLTYDIYAEETTPEYKQVKSMVLVLENGEIALDGKTTSANITALLGYPSQNTDGYLKYTDDAGYTYKFATENKKGILTQVQISYPK